MNQLESANDFLGPKYFDKLHLPCHNRRRNEGCGLRKHIPRAPDGAQVQRDDFRAGQYKIQHRSGVPKIRGPNFVLTRR